MHSGDQSKHATTSDVIHLAIWQVGSLGFRMRAQVSKKEDFERGQVESIGSEWQKRGARKILSLPMADRRLLSSLSNNLELFQRQQQQLTYD